MSRNLRTKEISISEKSIDQELWNIMSTVSIDSGSLQEISMSEKKKSSKKSEFIQPLIRNKKSKRKGLIVCDFETLLLQNPDKPDESCHIPYAVGYLVVKPGIDMTKKDELDCTTFITEDYNIFISDFYKKSDKMIFDFLRRLKHAAVNNGIQDVYFHNLGGFDGIFLLRYFAKYDEDYQIKTVVKNNKIYQISVYGKKNVHNNQNDNKKKNTKISLLYNLKDSLLLLSGSLESLAMTLCPELGTKESIDHQNVRIDNLDENKNKLLSYMKQDIYMLGGIMLKAQEIIWNQYKIDITDCLTVSSLAMRIFRTIYYDIQSFPIHKPNRNMDTFIRRGYYGGHAEVYKPYGTNLYQYDINSLYPYVMKTFDLPSGVPVWRDKLMNEPLTNLFGFIEAVVECPSSMNRPFLPYRKANGTLLFPTGTFVGVYYSEELLYAQKIGYKMTPVRGWLYEKKPSPFDKFISDIYEKRIEAKKNRQDSMVFIYKLLMNSLYGRFGLNPLCSIGELCDYDRKEFIIEHYDQIIDIKEPIKGKDIFFVKYKENCFDNSVNGKYKYPSLCAVQLSAAITACARIHMYQYISLDDCYYTDTDSVVLSQPLDDIEVSSTELGKFKLERYLDKGIFLAPKSYYVKDIEGKEITKQKGMAKQVVDPEWFELQYINPFRELELDVTNNFVRDLSLLKIIKKDSKLTVKVLMNEKRIANIDDTNNKWLDTEPINIIDYGNIDKQIIIDLEQKKREEIEIFLV